MILGVTVMIYDGLTRDVKSLSPPPDPSAFIAIKPATLLLFFGPGTFIYIIHYCALPIENEMTQPSEFTFCLSNVVIFTTLCEIAVG